MLSYVFWALLVLVSLMGFRNWSLTRVVESAREMWALLTEKAKKNESKPQEGAREEEKKAA